MSTELKIRTTSAADTKSVAAALAAALKSGDLLVLLGDLGAGKTCFTQGLANGLGIEERVTSPTFTLVNHYRGRLALHHLDVYRIEGSAEALDLDLHELAEDGVTVIEWGHNILDALPDSRLEIHFSYDDSSNDGRAVVMEGVGSAWASRLSDVSDLLKAWQRDG